jgi:gamma-glutamyl hercynylcysteine S-oxide synthase
MELDRWVRDARRRSFDLLADLADGDLLGPRLPIVNPLRWEIGHVTWFQERWFLRHVLGRQPLRADADRLYDSIAIAHDLRWDLPLPTRAETLDYAKRVAEQVLEALARGQSGPDDGYFVRLGVLHEDMHDEAFAYTRQTLELGAPPFAADPLASGSAGGLAGDATVPGGSFRLGAEQNAPFAFDNEKWAHELRVEPFSIARAPVTQAEFAEFVGDGGYRRPELWTEQGLGWKRKAGAEHPVYWRRSPDGWLRRHFSTWRALEPDRPVLHVCCHEAEAFCRWAGRRLPAEVEWEVAAAAEPDASGTRLAERKRRFPWGDEPPSPERANLGLRFSGALDVGALPAGDSAFGCRQMIGNVWEWTATPFAPYPGFVVDPYKEYSEPWFHTHRVLRGGCFATQGRLIRNTWRNFYTPDRRDVLAGFRTCKAS